MSNFVSNRFLFFYSFYFTAIRLAIVTNAENSHGWEPSVSVADPLDEPQKFGFCLDFFGAGSILTCDLHARSCKKDGGDTQFEYHLPTKAVRAVNYNFNCRQDSNPNTRGCVIAKEMKNGAPLTVGKCDAEDEKQIFNLVESGDDYELHLGEDLCLAVGDASRRPADFAPPLAMKRDLSVTECASLPEEQKTWAIKPKPTMATETVTVETSEEQTSEEQTSEEQSNEEQASEEQSSEEETSEEETSEVQSSEEQVNVSADSPAFSFRNPQFLFSFSYVSLVTFGWSYLMA